jgi:hypothetical protein
LSENLLLDSNRLSKVTREVNVQALKDSQPVGNKLEGNDVENTLKAVDGLGDLNLLSLGGLELLVIRVADDNGLAAASNDLLIGVERLLEEIIASQDHDDGEVLVDKGKDTMLEFAGHNSLAVKVRNFLNLQGTLKSSGKLAATAKKEQRLLVLEGLLAQFLDGGILLKNLLDLRTDMCRAVLLFVPAVVLGMKRHCYSMGYYNDLGVGLQNFLV